MNINNISEKNLSNLISIVQQDVFLFNLSIEENIRIGKPDASKKEIIEAAKKARIHDFIISLKDGYDTLLGENGVKFSGGEKQRINGISRFGSAAIRPRSFQINAIAAQLSQACVDDTRK